MKAIVKVFHQVSCPAREDDEGICNCESWKSYVCEACRRFLRSESSTCKKCDQAQRKRDRDAGKALREAGNDFQKAVEKRTYEAVAAVMAAEAALAEALDALDELHDWQNGPPLIKYEKEWHAADQKASAVLRKHGRLPQALGTNDNEEAQ